MISSYLPNPARSDCCNGKVFILRDREGALAYKCDECLKKCEVLEEVIN